ARARISLGIARVGGVSISLVAFGAVGAVLAAIGGVLGGGGLRGAGIVGRLVGGLVGVIAGPGALQHSERGLTVDRVTVGGHRAPADGVLPGRQVGGQCPGDLRALDLGLPVGGVLPVRT